MSDPSDLQLLSALSKIGRFEILNVSGYIKYLDARTVSRHEGTSLPQARPIGFFFPACSAH
jgi:hypothetical protein